jgi:hypothetical protein
MHLFMFYVGGNAGKSNIEVHDIQFVVARTPEEAWPALREAWFGDADKIHIDGYSRIRWADGYEVTLARTPAHDGVKLFFVNAGGYRPTPWRNYMNSDCLRRVMRGRRRRKRRRCCAAPGSSIRTTCRPSMIVCCWTRWATGIYT